MWKLNAYLTFPHNQQKKELTQHFSLHSVFSEWSCSSVFFHTEEPEICRERRLRLCSPEKYIQETSAGTRVHFKINALDQCLWWQRLLSALLFKRPPPPSIKTRLIHYYRTGRYSIRWASLHSQHAQRSDVYISLFISSNEILSQRSWRFVHTGRDQMFKRISNNLNIGL